MRKSQSGIIGLYVAVPLVMILIIYFVNNHYISAINIEKQSTSEALQHNTMQIIDVLTKTKGEPADWENSNNITSIGLNKIVLDLKKEKIDKLDQMSYNDTKKIFSNNLYDFYLELSYLNGTILLKKGNLTNSSDIFGAERKSFYNDVIFARLWQWD